MDAVKREETAEATLGASRESDGYVLEDQVGHLLRRAHQRHTAIFMEHDEPVPFTPTQFAAMFKVRELGAVSQNRLGRLVAMDAATMQGVVHRLIERGLVRRRRDTNDRRRVVLQLTKQGEAALDGFLPSAVRITEETLAPLGPEERQTFLDLLRRLT